MRALLALLGRGRQGEQAAAAAAAAHPKVCWPQGWPGATSRSPGAAQPQLDGRGLVPIAQGPGQGRLHGQAAAEHGLDQLHFHQVHHITGKRSATDQGPPGARPT